MKTYNNKNKIKRINRNILKVKITNKNNSNQVIKILIILMKI